MRVRTIKKRAVTAYACKSHRDTFDQRQRETVGRKAAEREAEKQLSKDQRRRRRA